MNAAGAAGRSRPVPVDDLDDPRLAPYRDLRAHERLAAEGLFIVETRHVVRRLLAEGRFAVRSLLLTETAERALAPFLDEHAPEAVRYLATKARLAELAGYRVHQGCLALVERGRPRSSREIIEHAARGRRVLLVLEGVANPDNVGGIFRNALGFGADAVLLAAGGADPLYRKSVRVSMGATLQVPFARLADWPGDLSALRAAGFACWATVAAGDAATLDAGTLGGPAAWPERIALVFGGEGDGLSAEARAACDASITIPTAAGFDSLNVSTAAAILLHRLGRLACHAEEAAPCDS